MKRTVVAVALLASPFVLIGGTGAYRSAHGDGTIVLPTDVPNQPDASVVLRLR